MKRSLLDDTPQHLFFSSDSSESFGLDLEPITNLELDLPDYHHNQNQLLKLLLDDQVLIILS